jgi:hypothetical protein
MPNTVTNKGATRGGDRDTRRSCDKMGVEVLGKATTNVNKRGATKGGGVMNGGGQGAGRRRDKRERLRLGEMRQPTE